MASLSPQWSPPWVRHSLAHCDSISSKWRAFYALFHFAISYIVLHCIWTALPVTEFIDSTLNTFKVALLRVTQYYGLLTDNRIADTTPYTIYHPISWLCSKKPFHKTKYSPTTNKGQNTVALIRYTILSIRKIKIFSTLYGKLVD